MITVEAATFCGKRTVNEDFCQVSGDGVVLADGMGGLVTGVVAASLAAHGIIASLENGTNLAGAFRAAHELIAAAAATERMPEGPLARAVEARIGDRVRSLFAAAAEGRLTLTGMGAAVAACVMRGETLELAHVGDVRVYRLRGGILERLTTDHALPPPHAHIITRALGVGRFEDPPARLEALAPGDEFLLCTDGLHRFVDDASLKLSSPSALRDAALAHGSDDNIGVVLLRIGAGDISVKNDPAL